MHRLNFYILKTSSPEFGIYFYRTIDGTFYLQIGLYNRFLVILLG